MPKAQEETLKIEISYAMVVGDRVLGSRTCRTYCDNDMPGETAVAVGTVLANMVESMRFDIAGDGMSLGALAAVFVKEIAVPDKTDFQPVKDAADKYMRLGD